MSKALEAAKWFGRDIVGNPFNLQKPFWYHAYLGVRDPLMTGMIALLQVPQIEGLPPAARTALIVGVGFKSFLHVRRALALA